MTTKTEIQALLRFLTQDAKVPLPIAMSKVKELQKEELIKPESFAKVPIAKIQALFPDEKQAKQILTAAKRVSKKRAAGDESLPVVSPAKRIKKDPFECSEQSPTATEEALTLPTSDVSEEELRGTCLHTNRAPLSLAFAVTLLKYTLPDQPLSSRLSLAQAVVSVNSRSKAISLGIEKGSSAEMEGWGEGQPTVKIMGREIKVMRRWGYDWRQGDKDVKPKGLSEDEVATQETIKEENSAKYEEPALWGLDLEALRSSKDSLVTHVGPSNGAGLPVHTPQSARAYLVKSFASPSPPDHDAKAVQKKKPSAAALFKVKEHNLAKLLQALDLLFISWAPFLSRDELDKRAWSWYVTARPDVQHGVAGWGGKGEVSLKSILDLSRRG